MPSERSARAAFSRLEICVVVANLILLVLILIPAFRPGKPLELAPDVASRFLPADAPDHAKAVGKNQ